MAALPKKKISKVRGKTRRNHYRTKLLAVSIDEKTGEAKLTHRVSPASGFYKGVKVVKTKADKSSK